MLEVSSVMWPLFLSSKCVISFLVNHINQLFSNKGWFRDQWPVYYATCGILCILFLSITQICQVNQKTKFNFWSSWLTFFWKTSCQFWHPKEQNFPSSKLDVCSNAYMSYNLWVDTCTCTWIVQKIKLLLFVQDFEVWFWPRNTGELKWMIQAVFYCFLHKVQGQTIETMESELHLKRTLFWKYFLRCNRKNLVVMDVDGFLMMMPSVVQDESNPREAATEINDC